MQIQETGEERNAFEGSGFECENWIDENESNYPESQFYMERAGHVSTYCMVLDDWEID
jgi:hypothetical protein